MRWEPVTRVASGWHEWWRGGRSCHRVSAAGSAAASRGLTALAPLISGLLVEHFSGHWAMAAFAAAMSTAAVLAMAMPGLNNDASVAGDEGTP